MCSAHCVCVSSVIVATCPVCMLPFALRQLTDPKVEKWTKMNLTNLEQIGNLLASDFCLVKNKATLVKYGNIKDVLMQINWKIIWSRPLTLDFLFPRRTYS